jgi:NAD(P)-dependent dehydrogenase (short-subunit alcohol dehydrogenase family)
MVGDVGDDIVVEQFAATIDKSRTLLKAVIHNAARGAPAARVADVSLADFREDLSDILIGGFLLAKHLSDQLRHSAPASMIFISSSAALRGARGRGPSYAAAKAGLHGLMYSLAIELSQAGVTVNSIAPSQTLTPRVLRGGRRTPSTIIERARNYVPLGRPADPADIAQAVYFLCSPGARYITGKIIELDGGQSLAPVWTTDEN